MSFSKPTTLGVIACPGGEKFASEITTHLKTIYKRRFEKKAASLAKQYNMTHEEALRELNLANDLTSHRVYCAGDPGTYRMPSFKIPTKFTRFANGEFKAEISYSVRGRDIYIIQDIENSNSLSFTGSSEPMQLSVNDHIFCLLVTVDAAIQSGARKVTCVLPSYPYARQHKSKGREGLTASTMGRILENMGVNTLLTLDIHSHEIAHTFTSLSLENLHASYQILRKLDTVVDLKSPDLVVVSPDTGAIARNKYFAGSLQKPLALLYKERDYSKISRDASDSNITNIRLLGDVKDKIVFMADDMLGTGGTLIKAMKQLKELGAKDIICAVSLPLFTGNAIEYFDDAYKKGYFTRIIGTNAVSSPEAVYGKEWFVCANVSNLFARTISRLHHNRSLSPILDNSKIIQKLLK